MSADACISYQTLCEALENLEKDLHEHIHLENNILFPKALAMEDALEPIVMEIENRTTTVPSENYLPDVVSRYPATRAVFDRYGLQGCGGRLGPAEQVGWFAGYMEWHSTSCSLN